MNGLLWTFAIVLAVVFLVTGFVKVFSFETARKRFTWVSDLPRFLVNLFGIIEILGALGLVLPALTRSYAWLMPWAAAGLALLMLMAVMFHLLRREYDNMLENGLLFLIAAFVSYGRLVLSPLS